LFFINFLLTGNIIPFRKQKALCICGENLQIDNTDSYSENLKSLIPNYADLNDALYWYSIERVRSARTEIGKALSEDWFVAGGDHYCAFDTNSFSRLINYIVNRTLQDDKLIALRRAFIVYAQAG
jgi:hypothetical protein